jgi:hypothetical protein
MGLCGADDDGGKTRKAVGYLQLYNLTHDLSIVLILIFVSIQEESSLDVQKRIAREFYDTVEDIPLDE